MLDQPRLINSGIINLDSLTFAYDSITHTLEKNDIRCTAAFVSAFAAPLELLFEQRHLLETQFNENPNWFDSIRKVNLFEDKRFYNAGFNGSKFFDRMKADGHEMAWHGSTHLPWDNSSSVDSIRREIDIFDQINSGLNVNLTTMIFPRNKIGHLAELKQSKITTFRDGETYSTFGRALNLCKEFTSYNASKQLEPAYVDNLWIHPKGDFLNWPSGVRGMVPTAVSWLRWKAMIDNAVESNGYVHMWFHPHNIITSNKMLSVFTKVIDYIGALKKGRYIHDLTMHEHTQAAESKLKSLLNKS